MINQASSLGSSQGNIACIPKSPASIPMSLNTFLQNNDGLEKLVSRLSSLLAKLEGPQPPSTTAPGNSVKQSVPEDYTGMLRTLCSNYAGSLETAHSIIDRIENHL